MSSRFLQQLRREHSLDGGVTGQRLYYRLEPGGAHLRMSLVAAREQPNGRLEAAQPYRLQPAHLAQPPLFLDAADVELLRRLSDSEPAWLHCSERELPAAAGPDWLRALTATGRARGANGAVVTWTEPLAVACAWHIDDAGNQRLSWQQPAGIHLLPTSPPCAWDTLQQRLAPLATELPVEALAWLAQAPTLAPAEVAAFVARHGATLLDWGLPLPRTIAETVLSPRPQPQLRLSSDTSRQDTRGDRLCLQFVYDCHGLSAVFAAADDAPERRLYHRERGELFTLCRDREGEAALERTLDEALAAYAPQRLPGGAFGFGGRARWQAVMTEPVPRLKQQGWRLQAEPGFRHHFVTAERLRLAAAWLERDWFELALHVEIEGEALPLLPLLADCARRYSREWLQELSADETLPVSLPDGRQLLLPAARLAHWLAVLVELGEGTPADALRLPAAQLHRLTAFDQGDLQRAADTEALLEQARQLAASPVLDGFTLPAWFNAELRAYQHLGVAWLQQRRRLGVGGILADDMGLGKTVQTLAHLAIEHEHGRLQQPALVVAPTSVLHNWQQEAARFAPQLRTLLLHGPQRHGHWEQLEKYDLVLTSYALVVNDIEQWQRQPLSVVILDEAQIVKNARAQVSQRVRELQAPYRLCLTGTPLENHLGELWSLFEFLMPRFLDSEARFNRHYRKPIENDGDEARAQALMARIAPFILRRTKEDVATDLPPKTEVLVRLPLQDAQRDLYEMLRQHSVNRLQQRLAGSDDGSGRVLILNALLQLRQVCCDPRLIDAAEHRGAPSAKREHLLAMVRELVDEGRAMLVFSQFTRMLDLIAADLAAAGIGYLMLTGRSRNRGELVAQFQAGAAPVLLVSLKAGGTGLNLTRADTVIHCDPWWNSAAENQATDRAYRIGQDKPVFVYKLLAEDTVEEKIHALQQYKHGLLDQVYRGAQANTEGLTLDNAALMALLETA